MARMELSTLRAILVAERADASADGEASTLAAERKRAMDYYLGDMGEDMPALPGRSSAVSTDVADVVHGLMPSLMEIFCASDEVVEFEPVGPEDVEAAQQETDYVNHVFMQKNAGFQVLYDFIFDALLQKNGIAKVFWERSEREQRESYFDLDDDTLALLLADPEIEIVEHTVRDVNS
jgi:Na+-transporting NADH:ubiquinone oxidoreductase subunit NqrF